MVGKGSELGLPGSGNEPHHLSRHVARSTNQKEQVPVSTAIGCASVIPTLLKTLSSCNAML